MPKEIQCPLCGKKVRSGTLQYHKQQLHGETEAPIKFVKTKRKKEKPRLKTTGPGNRTKSSDWNKVK